MLNDSPDANEIIISHVILQLLLLILLSLSMFLLLPFVISTRKVVIIREVVLSIN